MFKSLLIDLTLVFLVLLCSSYDNPLSLLQLSPISPPSLPHLSSFSPPYAYKKMLGYNRRTPMVDHQNSHPNCDTGKLPPWAANFVNVIAPCICATVEGDSITMPDLLPLVHSQGKFLPLHLHNPDPAAEDKLSRYWQEGIQSILVSLP